MAILNLFVSFIIKLNYNKCFSLKLIKFHNQSSLSIANLKVRGVVLLLLTPAHT